MLSLICQLQNLLIAMSLGFQIGSIYDLMYVNHVDIFPIHVDLANKFTHQTDCICIPLITDGVLCQCPHRCAI